MRHLIERVLELAEEEEGPTIRPTSVEEMDSNDAELKRLLESLQPRIRVYGAGGAGCNAVSRLHEERRIIRKPLCHRTCNQHRCPGITDEPS